MTTYDIAKVRAACLELMGMTLSELGWATDADGSISDVDPTTSLDDALPLWERFRFSISYYARQSWNDPHDRYFEVTGIQENSEPGTLRRMVGQHETNPALALCLCALRCAGRDLRDFEVKE